MKTELRNYILDHAHLVLNERREYLDGRLIVRDGRIADVQAQTREVSEEYAGLPAVDLRGRAVLPLACAFCLPYAQWKEKGEEELFAEGFGSYVLLIDRDIRFSLSRLREIPHAGCRGVILKTVKEEIPDHLKDETVLGFLLTPEEADEETLNILRLAGKKILFTDSDKVFPAGEKLGEDIILAELLKTGNLGIRERRLLNLAFEQKENYRVFRPEKENLHLLKLIAEQFYTDTVIFDLSSVRKEEVLKALRDAKVPFRTIAAYFSLNAKRCLSAAEETSLQKGRSADLCCVDNSGRILFSVKEGVCYR